MVYSLSLYYPTHKYGWGCLDRMIERIAPGHLMGMGTATPSGVRDLQFTFEQHQREEFDRAVKKAHAFARGRSGVRVDTTTLE